MARPSLTLNIELPVGNGGRGAAAPPHRNKGINCACKAGGVCVHFSVSGFGRVCLNSSGNKLVVNAAIEKKETCPASIVDIA